MIASWNIAARNIALPAPRPTQNQLRQARIAGSVSRIVGQHVCPWPADDPRAAAWAEGRQLDEAREHAEARR